MDEFKRELPAVATHAHARDRRARERARGRDVWTVEEGDVERVVEVGASSATRGWGEVSTGCQGGVRRARFSDGGDDDDDGDDDGGIVFEADVRTALVTRGKGAIVTRVRA